MYTGWKYAEETDTENIPVEAGIRHLMITDAELVENDQGMEGNDIYQLTFTDLQNDASFRLRYWINDTMDKQGNILNPPKRNHLTNATLISLKYAVSGERKGYPIPEDIVGAVVKAEVVLKPGKSGGAYPRIYKFSPVSSEWALMGTLDYQFTDDSADDPPEIPE